MSNIDKISQFQHTHSFKTRRFLRKKFIEAARLHGHLAYLTLISHYDEDLYNDPLIKLEEELDGSLKLENYYLILDNELNPQKHRYWDKDFKHYVNSEEVVAYIWNNEWAEEETDDYLQIRKLIGAIVRWSYYDERDYIADNARSYRVTEISSDPSYVVKIHMRPYIENIAEEIKKDSESTNFSWMRDERDESIE